MCSRITVMLDIVVTSPIFIQRGSGSEGLHELFQRKPCPSVYIILRSYSWSIISLVVDCIFFCHIVKLLEIFLLGFPAVVPFSRSLSIMTFCVYVHFETLQMYFICWIAMMHLFSGLVHQSNTAYCVFIQ